MSSSKLYRLDCFEEAVGTFHELKEKDGILVADIGKVHLALPITMEENLRPFVRQKIAILRTDLPQKEYLFRVLTEEPSHMKNDGLGG